MSQELVGTFGTKEEWQRLRGGRRERVLNSTEKKGSKLAALGQADTSPHKAHRREKDQIRELQKKGEAQGPEKTLGREPTQGEGVIGRETRKSTV